MARASSPDREKDIVVFGSDCGATTAASLHISIVPRGHDPEDGGNVLIVNHMPSYSARYRPVWTGNADVVVPYAKTAKVFVKNAQVDGVRVIFKPLSPDM